MSGSPTLRALNAKIDEALQMLHTQSLHVTNIDMKFDGLDQRLNEQIEPRLDTIETQATALEKYIHYDNGQDSLASQVKAHGEWIDNWQASRSGWAAEFRRSAVSLVGSFLVMVAGTIGMLTISHNSAVVSNKTGLTTEDVKKIAADEFKTLSTEPQETASPAAESSRPRRVIQKPKAKPEAIPTPLPEPFSRNRLADSPFLKGYYDERTNQ